MNTSERYAKAVAWTCPPAFVVGLACGLAAVTGLSLVMLAAFAMAFPAVIQRALAEGLKALLVLALLSLAIAVLGLGSFVFVIGLGSHVTWMVLSGGVIALAGFALTRGAVVSFVVKKPPPAAVPVVVPRAIVPATRVEVVRPPSPPPPPPLEAVKKKVRELVLWAGMRKPATLMDQGYYMLSGPPGRGKSTLMRLFLKAVIEEVLDPDSESVLICFDPKRENYAWIASRVPRERDSLVPLWLFCPSDQRTCTLDWIYDFFSSANHATCALSMSPENPQLVQPFFENAFRTIVAEVIGAIQRKMGTWDLRLLMSVLSNPGYIKKLVGNDKYARFVEELLSARSEETAQNVQMEIASKVSKWRKIAAHLSHVRKARTLSLERLLSRRGILVIQKDDDYREQHNAMNAMLLQRLGQILMKRQEDPTGKRKVYIVIDEFPSLGYMKGLVDMMRELRSRGVVFVVAWQSWANMEHVWKEEAYSILGTLQNFIILGSADPKDAELAAKLIGKVRGWEAERGESASDGTSENETEGSSDTKGWSSSETRMAGAFRNPPPVFGSYAPGFTATDTRGVSGSRTTQQSTSRGVSHQETRSVTWRYFERDIRSPTEIMRSPWPTTEGGFHGVGYCVGEPDVCDFHYESELMEREGVFETNDHIPRYMEWPSEKYQLLEGLTRGELERLGLIDVDPSDPEAYPTPEEYEARNRQEEGRGPEQEEAVDAAEDDSGGLTEGEQDQWRDEFLDGQE